MPRKIIDFDLDLFQKNILPVCSLKQFDECTLNINLKSDGEVYNATGCNAAIYISCKNDIYKQDTGITVNESTVKVLLKKEMLQKHGKALAEIELKNSEGVITTTTFILDIDGKIGEGSTLPGEIEGFIALHERLIREFKKEYNNKINELISFDENVKLQLGQMETDFNEAVANATNGNESATNSEVVLARKGKTSLREKIDEVDSQIKDKANKEDVARISAGTPLFADSVTKMTDITRNYVNTSDGYLYMYTGGSWINSNIKYQETGLSDKQVTKNKTNFITQSKNLFNKYSEDNIKGYYFL